jgi:hypothetical protein
MRIVITNPADSAGYADDVKDFDTVFEIAH